eukprot:9826123-Alexandrium_andersonii.AAC.1
MVQCGAAQRSTARYSAAWRGAVRGGAVRVQCSPARRGSVWCSAVVQCGAVKCSEVRRDAA